MSWVKIEGVEERGGIKEQNRKAEEEHQTEGQWYRNVGVKSMFTSSNFNWSCRTSAAHTRKCQSWNNCQKNSVKLLISYACWIFIGFGNNKTYYC